MKQKDRFGFKTDLKTTGSDHNPFDEDRGPGMSSSEPKALFDDRDLQTIDWVRSIPDLEPPPDLLTSVMQFLQPKRLPRMKRLARWAKSPKSVTFVPLRLAPVALILIGLMTLSVYWAFERGPQPYSIRGEDRIPVAFNLKIPEARSVAVVGTFNGWKPKGYEMQFIERKNAWSITVYLPEGRHEYAFLVDGQKVIPDPEALLYQDDGFGSENSVLVLRAPYEDRG